MKDKAKPADMWKNLRPMRAHHPWLIVTAALILGLLARIRPPADDASAAGRFDEPDAAAWQDVQRRAPSDGSSMPALYAAAVRHVEGLSRFASRIGRPIPTGQDAARVWIEGSRVVAAGQRVSATAVLDTWTPLGPGNIGGRTRVVRFHPLVPTTIFAAGVSGGMWKSDDNGTTWRPAGDGLTNIAVNALLIDPARPDVMYAGTGEGHLREEIRGTGLPLRGNGIFVTRNGGGTWQQLPATNTADFLWVNDLEFGVNDKQRIYAATRTGVWRSTDAGTTWARLLETSVRGGCIDLAMRPDRHEDVLFAACGSYDQGTVYRFPTAATRSDVEVVLRDPSMGRTSLAIAPSSPDVVYALAASNVAGPGGNYQQGLLAVFRSERGGVAGSWEARVTNQDATYLHTLLLTNPAAANIRACAPTQTPQIVNMGWYNNIIAVDPLDANRVWAAGVDWFRSDDGGRTWGLANWGSGPSSVHVDQHAISFHPGYDGTSNQTVLIGNDGGIYRTANARAAVGTGPRATCDGGGVGIMWSSLNRGYGVTQFYHGTAFPDGVQYVGGTQDNGTLLGSDAAGPDGWRPIYGGDGGFTAVNAADPRTLFAEFQWSNIARSINGGTNFVPMRNGLDAIVSSTLGPEANFLFVTPFTMDPRLPSVLWLGGEYLYRTIDANNWSKAPMTRMPDGGVVSAIAVSPHNSGHILAGTHKGDIAWTRNGTDAPGAITSRAVRPRAGWVTSVAFDPRDVNVLYATYGNFGGAHVYRSVDGGESWASIDGSGANRLPDIPVHAIAVDPDEPQRLYLGTDLGVMVSIDAGRTWMAEETGFGPAVTMWLSTVKGPGGTYLFAFTHGRGAWRVRLR